MSILLTMVCPISALAQSAISLKEYKSSKQILRLVGAYMLSGGTEREDSASMVLENGNLRFLMICSNGRICNIPEIPLKHLGQTVTNKYAGTVSEYSFDGDTLTCQVTTRVSRWVRVVRRLEFKLSGAELLLTDTQVLQRRKFLRRAWIDDDKSSEGYHFFHDYKGRLVKVSDMPLPAAEMWKISDDVDPVRAWLKRKAETRAELDPVSAWLESREHEVIDLAPFQTKPPGSSPHKKRSQSAEIFQFPGAKNGCAEDLTAH